MDAKKTLLTLLLLASFLAGTQGKAINENTVQDTDDNNNADQSASDMIYNVNAAAGVLKVLFEEDILLDPDRVAEVAQWKNGNIVAKRGAIKDKNYRWPGNTLYYQFDSSFTDDRSPFYLALNEISDKTCIQFQERISPQGSYVKVVGSRPGCSSYVGYLRSSQELSIGRGCNHQAIIVHELLHALGFWHEQSRPDRDKYIKVLNENIQPGRKSNFLKHLENETEELGLPYDFASVMHYGRKAYSRNGKPTIIANDVANRSLGRSGLSAGDEERLVIYYNCTASGEENTEEETSV